MQMKTSTSLSFSKLKNEGHERKNSFYIFKKQRHAMHLRLNHTIHAYKATTCSFLPFLYKCKRKKNCQEVHADNVNKAQGVMVYNHQTEPRIP